MIIFVIKLMYFDKTDSFYRNFDWNYWTANLFAAFVSEENMFFKTNG